MPCPLSPTHESKWAGSAPSALQMHLCGTVTARVRILWPRPDAQLFPSRVLFNHERKLAMAQVTVSDAALKRLLKEALSEALVEQRDLLREVLAEVVEELALIEAIKSGRETELVERGEVFRTLGGRS